MFSIKPDVWLPIVTLVAGVLLKAVVDWISEGRSFRREQIVRRETRRDAARLRQIEFQRSTLLELQDQLSAFIRMTAAAHHQDVIAHREGSQWRRQMLSPDVNEGFNVSQRAVLRLSVRVREETIRGLSASINKACVAVTQSPHEEAGTMALGMAAGYFEQVNERIGEVLRDLDDDEEAVIGRSKDA